jgi:hypothetical protein
VGRSAHETVLLTEIRWEITLGFYLVVLATAFRITAFTHNVNKGTFVTVVLLATGYCFCFPRRQYWTASIILLGLGTSFLFIPGELIRGWIPLPQRDKYAWHWDTLFPRRNVWLYLGPNRPEIYSAKYFICLVLCAPYMMVARIASVRIHPLLSGLFLGVLPALTLFTLAYPSVAEGIDVPSLLLLEAVLWLLVLTECSYRIHSQFQVSSLGFGVRVSCRPRDELEFSLITTSTN